MFLQGSNHVTSNVRFENFTERQNNAAGSFCTKEPYNDDLKHNSYPLITNQNTHLSKAERDHIMLFNPLTDGLSGSLSGNRRTNRITYEYK